MTASAAAPQGAAAFPCSLLLPVIYSFGRFILSGNFFCFFAFLICISVIICYITHHSLRMRDEVLEVKVNKI